MNKPTLSKVACILFAFCASTAITSPAQILTTLHSFAGPPSDGARPIAGLVRASDGNFYGTAEGGGYRGNLNCSTGCGTVFKISANGTFTALHNFFGADGANPGFGPLVQASDGNFYGTTENGGANKCSPYPPFGCGTVFKITPSGALTTLYSFCSQSGCSDGAVPVGGLVQASDGNFYGTTAYGGIYNNGCEGTCGTVFKITPSGALTTLYSFCSQDFCADGATPFAGLVQASDGSFYGTTEAGGANCLGLYGCGTVFKITPTGTLTPLYSFCTQSGCTDGAVSSAVLVQATDGNFYGTTVYGGTSGNCGQGCGTVFKMTPAGALTTLHSFSGADGSFLAAGLLQASDGNFYGTTDSGGSGGNCYGGCGTVFKITPSGTLTTLHAFNGGDGANPAAALVQATDGNFYGTTSHGGTNNYGTVFRLVTKRACVVCPSVE